MYITGFLSLFLKEWGYLSAKDRGCAYGPTGGLRAVWPMLKKCLTVKCLTSVEFVIFFLFLQPQLLQIHLSPANLTTAIHFTLASHKQISTNFNAFKIHWYVSLQTLQNINTSHQHSKKLHWLPIIQRKRTRLTVGPT